MTIRENNRNRGLETMSRNAPAFDAHVWICCGEAWLARERKAPMYVGLEALTNGLPSTIVDDFARARDSATKIVAVSGGDRLLTHVDRSALARRPFDQAALRSIGAATP